MSTQAALRTWTPLKLLTDVWKFIVFPALFAFQGEIQELLGLDLLHFTLLLLDICPPYSSSDCCSKTEGQQELPLHETAITGIALGNLKYKKKRLFLQETTKNKECSCDIAFPLPFILVKRHQDTLIQGLPTYCCLRTCLEKRKITLMKGSFQPCTSNFIN